MKKVIALEGVYVYAKEAQRQREEAAAALAIESLLCRQNRRWSILYTLVLDQIQETRL